MGQWRASSSSRCLSQVDGTARPGCCQGDAGPGCTCSWRAGGHLCRGDGHRGRPSGWGLLGFWEVGSPGPPPGSLCPPGGAPQGLGLIPFREVLQHLPHPHTTPFPSLLLDASQGCCGRPGPAGPREPMRALVSPPREGPGDPEVVHHGSYNQWPRTGPLKQQEVPKWRRGRPCSLRRPRADSFLPLLASSPCYGPYRRGRCPQVSGCPPCICLRPLHSS